MTIDDTNAAPSGEDKQWADLAAEVEIEIGDEGGEGTGADKPAEAEPEGEPDGEQKQPQVPYEELERRARQTAAALKEARQEAQAQREQNRAFTQMVEEMRAQRKAPAAEEAKPEAVPDPDEDPIAFMKHKFAEIEGRVGETQKAATETRAQAQEREEFQQFTGWVLQAEEAFKVTVPDYHDAAKYLEDSRRAEIALLVPDSPQMENYARQQGLRNVAHLRDAMFIEDAKTIARNAAMCGFNPAEVYYNLAKGRGYRPATPAQADAQKMERANNVIDATRRGAKASKTISGGGGGPDNPLNVADLTDLYAEDPEEFDKQWEKMRKSGQLG